MTYPIDIEALRCDLIDHFEEIAYCGMPVFLMDATEIEQASAQRIVQIAQNEHFDLRKYIIP